jgi:hypothetical protein
VTIREYLRTRAVLARVIGWVVCVALLFAVFSYRLHNWGSYGLYVVVWFAAMVGLLSLPQHQLVRFPRCQTDLANQFLSINTSKTQNCPQCGVRFDEPYRAGSS